MSSTVVWGPEAIERLRDAIKELVGNRYPDKLRLAELAGVSYPAMDNFISGITKTPRLPTLNKFQAGVAAYKTQGAIQVDEYAEERNKLSGLLPEESDRNEFADQADIERADLDRFLNGEKVSDPQVVKAILKELQFFAGPDADEASEAAKPNIVEDEPAEVEQAEMPDTSPTDPFVDSEDTSVEEEVIEVIELESQEASTEATSTEEEVVEAVELDAREVSADDSDEEEDAGESSGELIVDVDSTIPPLQDIVAQVVSAIARVEAGLSTSVRIKVWRDGDQLKYRLSHRNG